MVIPPIKKPKRKVYRYQKGDYESMRKDTLKFAKEKYFNGHSDTRSVQENFNLITSFIQDSADKHIPSKTSRSFSSVPWITPEIRRKIRKKNETHAKAKRTGSAKIRSKFETLRREIKADIRKQHDLYVNNLVGDVKANPRDFNCALLTAYLLFAIPLLLPFKKLILVLMLNKAWRNSQS